MNHNSKEYLNVALTADHNISADVVQFCILSQNAAATAPLVWSTATNTATGAQLLIGPGSPYGALAIGNYNVFVQIADSPEIPVLNAGVLRIT